MSINNDNSSEEDVLLLEVPWMITLVFNVLL
jgi:hypothetical protein